MIVEFFDIIAYMWTKILIIIHENINLRIKIKDTYNFNLEKMMLTIVLVIY